MAPRGAIQRRQTQSQNEHVFALGRVGRKTGITIPDNGRRDEHGFEELDNLFSSPDRELLNETNGRNGTVSEKEQDGQDGQDEQDMEIDDGSELGPATTRKLQQGQPSLPRARSPIKTNLKSPARQNPHLPPTSSPTRGTVVTAREQSPGPEVARRLDFSKSSQQQKMPASGRARPNGIGGRNKTLTNGHSQSARSNKQSIFSSSPSTQTEAEEEVEQLELLDAGTVDEGNAEDDVPEEPDQEIEEEEAPPIAQEPKPTNKSKPPGRRGRKPKASIEKENDDPTDASLASAPTEDNAEDEEPVKKRKGRPKAPAKQDREPTPPADPTPPPKASKRGRQARTSTDDVEEGSVEPRDAKRQRTTATADKAEQSTSSKPAPAKEKGKPGRKRKSSGVGVDSPMIQRGPPLPRSRGLVTVRREETTAMRTTRSGRASFKPLEWWKGDHVEYDEDQENIFEDTGKRHFKMPTVKGVVRTEENYESVPRRRGRPATGRKPGRRTSTVVEEELEREDWEYDDGRIIGEVVCWQPEHEHNPPEDDDDVEVVAEELAISEGAIQLKDIKDATFKFAKTLTLPFFGAGVVDLPPGAEKRLKNSRMRHLVFFVHTGNVRVTIAQSEFGIAKGGMFFVPRGNTYRIQNEMDRPARIFFAQGNEVFVQPMPEPE
ncbi:Mif2/CENP-C like-domain-containing protein [Xylaria digitata]|nr:Mif2/CENP-C like-domain-containing protein [Xylaria digitata]